MNKVPQKKVGSMLTHKHIFCSNMSIFNFTLDAIDILLYQMQIFCMTKYLMTANNCLEIKIVIIYEQKFELSSKFQPSHSNNTK